MNEVYSYKCCFRPPTMSCNNSPWYPRTWRMQKETVVSKFISYFPVGRVHEGQTFDCLHIVWNGQIILACSRLYCLCSFAPSIFIMLSWVLQLTDNSSAILSCMCSVNMAILWCWLFLVWSWCFYWVKSILRACLECHKVEDWTDARWLVIIC